MKPKSKYSLIAALLVAVITPSHALEKLSEQSMADISIAAAIKNPASELPSKTLTSHDQDRQIAHDQDRLLALQNNHLASAQANPSRIMEMPVNTALGDALLAPIINNMANTFFGQMGSVALSGVSINTTQVNVSIQGQQIPNLSNLGGTVGIR